MRTLLKNLFINNWPRKCLSIILAIIIWFVVNKSLITTKTISNVPVKIENIPPGKTIEGIQSNGLLNRRVNLTLSGNKSILEDLNANDLQIVFDASDQEGEWIASISRKNLRIGNSDLNISQGVSRVSQQNFIIKLTKLVSEKIPIIITQPIGEAPTGYQFVDIWPYQLNITVSGPEDIVKKLKNRGLNLTFNLNDITKTKLDELRTSSTKSHSDVVNFYIPNAWKQISIPSLSQTPIEINDPDARFLRIDFLRYEILKLNSPIPVSLYFPPNAVGTINPSKVNIVPNNVVENRSGIKMITETLYAKGVSALFLDVIKDMLEIAVIVNPNDDSKLEWSTQFINARALEERYLRFIKSDATDDDEFRDLQPHHRDNYLRNRFRNYMNRLQLYKSDNKVFELAPILQGNSVSVTETKQDES
ncbi:MAG: CdaR family protein [Candidatus Neptunochlamydia sp.]|nr:CdaR family protein [Candidatus Neptunochlamydia sp.]